jgi:carbon storage regulator CsrA
MLVLSRKSDESLTLFLPSGEKILIRVKDISGQTLSVCVDAPKDVRIVRTEMMSRPGFTPMFTSPPPSPQEPSRPTSPSPQPAS